MPVSDIYRKEPGLWKIGFSDMYKGLAYIGLPTIAQVKKKIPYVVEARPIFGDTFAITNPKRMGKTLLATFIIIERLKNEPWIEGFVANIPYNLEPIGMEDKFIYLSDIELIKELQGHYIVFIDELRRYVDSRMSMGKKQRFISNLIADLGKQKVDFYFTDQDIGAVDRRVRINVDYVLAPYYNPYTGWCRVLMFDSVENYVMFTQYGFGQPIYEFAFYGPPYFKYFPTEWKVEDYIIKFKVEKYAKEFLKWLEDHGWLGKVKLDAGLVTLWEKTEGYTFDSGEKTALLRYIRILLAEAKADEMEKQERKRGRRRRKRAS